MSFYFHSLCANLEFTRFVSATLGLGNLVRAQSEVILAWERFANPSAAIHHSTIQEYGQCVTAHVAF